MALMQKVITDTQRLDWLGKNEIAIRRWNRMGGIRFIELRDQDDQKVSEGANLREAIDNGMRKPIL